jgi:serine/threonine protein kinase
MLENGSILGGIYTVLHDVGRGGTSHVYLVLNTRAGKQWAAKEIPKDGGGEKGVIKRGLVTDVEMLKNLHHSGIPGIVDVIETPEYYYILMEYIEGVTLEQILKTEGEQSQEDVVKWGIQLCDVFTYLHTRDPKIIYRDTKPSNIMLKPDGNVVLIDFGSAREYKPLNVEDTNNLGTRGYAAPEQHLGTSQTDERTDIYNLGVTLYHLLTGHNPSRYPYDLYPIRHWNPSLSSGLESIVLKCTKSNPEERYQSAEELKYDLEHYTELDAGHLKKKKRLLITSAIAAALGVSCIVGSILLHGNAVSIEEANYESLIQQAQCATTKEDQIELYTKAINLKPQKATGYEELLERVFLEDNNFDSSESEALSNAMNTSDNQKTNGQQFAETDEYASFSYDLGLAYYYYYDGVGNKPMSESWLGIAKDSDALTDAQKQRAERLSKIASYYARLGQRNLAGDSEVSYADYWTDLDALSSGNLVSVDNAKTALVTYQEITYQIRMHATDFMKAGIEEEKLEDKLGDIEDHMSKDFTSGDKESYKDLYENIEENITQGKTAIDIAFHGQEG